MQLIYLIKKRKTSETNQKYHKPLIISITISPHFFLIMSKNTKNLRS